MTNSKKELIFIHGRSQQEKDSIALKAEWINSLEEGLEKSGLKLPIPESQVRFPYYGDTLAGLAAGLSENEAKNVILRGPSGQDDPDLQAFVTKVLEEVADRRKISDDIRLAVARAVSIERGGPTVIERGPLNWGWLQGLIRVLDQHLPGASGLSVALFTRDVYLYLKNGRMRGRINNGVQQAFTAGRESVVVGHSLGTVVAYWLLAEQGDVHNWNIPVFITLGSPLAVTEIKQALRQELGLVRHPRCVEKWFNAMDPNDVVSLYPLTSKHFPIDPEIENKIDVENNTDNQHGIRGYLNDKDVAQRIYNALMA